MRFAFWKRFKKPKVKSGLLFAFRHKGYDYYQYPEQLGMPMFRMAKLSEYNIWISRGCTKNQLMELIEIADKCLFEGISNSKNAAKLGSVLNEIKERENKAVPMDIWYNYLACCYVREDETDKEFNEEIQQQKAEAFRLAADESDSFFFRLPELRVLTTRSNILPIAWQSICQESMLQQKRHRELLKILMPLPSAPPAKSSRKGKV